MELTMFNESTAVEALKRSHERFLAKDMKGWSELCDENVLVEFPFAPEGSPRRLEGRSAIYEYLRGYPDMIDIHSIASARYYATDDPHVAIADWSVTGRVISNGNPYNMSYATFVTVKDGRIVQYREYWNPQAFQAALGGSSF
jgi:ketosteroid isomerase-like protein